METLDKLLSDFKDKNIKPTIEEVVSAEIERVDAKIDGVETDLNTKIDKAINIAENTSKQVGPKGDSYVLTPQDKVDIASSIQVPVVDKVIEKIEVIKEVPIVTETKTEIIKQVAITDTAEVIVDKINSLPLSDEFKIDASHIKNIPKKGVGVFGQGNMQIYVDGVLKGTTKYLNFIGGTNMSLTASAIGERTDILLDATSGGGGLTQLTATGAVNGSNTTYTFVSKPTYIISDGAWVRENKGWTWSNPIATMDVPPQTDIYGLS